ncbi:alanine racemase [Pelosinus sp. sgz500959]|uniref:alanine racemase n=1 Tax=Pelosinus sp. sgz500959 TaxID=3242472 RepID=UPI0036731DD3
MFERAVWAEIDLEAIAHNVGQIRKVTASNAQICAVVKADAYGHGAVAVARTVLQAGADRLAVAILNEALELRRAGFRVPILILGYTPDTQAAMVVDQDITQTIFTIESAQALSGAAVAAGKTVNVHIKIDTGMGRIGVRPEDAGDFAVAVSELPGIKIEGVFSHFANSDSADKSFAYEQYRRFTLGLELIEGKGIQIPIRHIANSAAILDLPDMHLDMVRPGIILYGLWPSDEVDHTLDLRPAMQLKTQVGFVKEMASHTSISYGRTYFTETSSIIATLPLGYADGWSRLLAHKAQVLLCGKRAPLVGRVCMDQCMVDVTHIPGVRVGDEVLLFGGPSLPVEEVAKHMETINYEIVCMVGKRVPRLYR